MIDNRRDDYVPVPRNQRPNRVSPSLRSVFLLFGLAALAAGCGSSGSGQSGSAFVFLSVDRFSLNGTSPVAAVNSSIDDLNNSTAVCVTLRNNLKNPTVTAPTGLDNVVIQSLTVRLNRFDGVPVPGSPFTFNTAVIVPAGSAGMAGVTGNTATFAIIVVPAQVKIHPSLRPPTRLPVNATADITFRGRDGRGQRVETQGAVSVIFVAEGEDATASCAGGEVALRPR